MLRVLVVDDEKIIRKSLTNYLEDFNCEVSSVDSAEAAVRAVDQEQWDAVIVDLRLPGISGDDFIRQVYDQTERTVFIIYAGTLDYAIEGEMKNFSRLSQKIFQKPLEDVQILLDEIERLRLGF